MSINYDIVFINFSWDYVASGVLSSLNDARTRLNLSLLVRQSEVLGNSRHESALKSNCMYGVERSQRTDKVTS